MRPRSFSVFSFNMRNSLYSRKRSSCREQFSLLQYTFEPHLLRQGFVIRYVEVIVSVARSTQVHNLDRQEAQNSFLMLGSLSFDDHDFPYATPKMPS